MYLQNLWWSADNEDSSASHEGNPVPDAVGDVLIGGVDGLIAGMDGPFNGVDGLLADVDIHPRERDAAIAERDIPI